MPLIKLDYFDWEQQFKPINKPGTSHIAFDTHEDWEFLQTIPNSRIWTLIDCSDSNDAVIVNGCHWVNRLEYYVTEVQHDEQDEYNVD